MYACMYKDMDMDIDMDIPLYVPTACFPPFPNPLIVYVFSYYEPNRADNEPPATYHPV